MQWTSAASCQRQEASDRPPIVYDRVRLYVGCTGRSNDAMTQKHDQHLHEIPKADWKEHGVKVIPGLQLDPNPPQTPGMTRAAAINRARAGAEKLWAGTVTIHANAKTGAHHHGDLESVIFVVKGRARMRWGERLEF